MAKIESGILSPSRGEIANVVTRRRKGIDILQEMHTKQGKNKRSKSEWNEYCKQMFTQAFAKPAIDMGCLQLNSTNDFRRKMAWLSFSHEVLQQKDTSESWFVLPSEKRERQNLEKITYSDCKFILTFAENPKTAFGKSYFVLIKARLANGETKIKLTRKDFNQQEKTLAFDFCEINDFRNVKICLLVWEGPIDCFNGRFTTSVSNSHSDGRDFFDSEKRKISFQTASAGTEK
ncbi:MAG: hypothetical protein ACI4VW_02760 [Acutalibacteraceae bacterium]